MSRRAPTCAGLRALAVLFASLAGPPALAGWQSLGAFQPPAREGDALVFHGPQGTLSIAPAGEGVVRVRFVPGGVLPRDRSFAVVGRPGGGLPPVFTVGAEASTVASGALRATIRHAPLRISFESGNSSLDADDADRGIAFTGESIRVAKRLRDDEHVYGLGEKTGPLDKRGNKLGGVSYAMWNSDTYGYDDATDPLYASIPFVLVLRQGRAHGLFLDNPGRTTFDVGKEAQELLTFGTDRGVLDYYLIDGPTPKEVIERYTALTGRMPLPPLWSLGYHQCRYSYFPESKVRFVARNFRERSIPADVLWLDIHYQDGYRPFTWDRTRFPDPRKLIGDLRADGFRTVVIVDPHPKKERGYAPYDEGLAGGHFVRRPDGTVFEAPVWPSRAERDPGPSVFPDFLRPATRAWWGRLYRGLVDLGVAGIWNDMDEPSVFDTPTGTFPLDLIHDDEGTRVTHRAVHNAYGMLMSRATHEGLLALRPGQRPFVLTRATYAGGQRYAALWLGDNIATWSHLQGSFPMLLGLGLSGMPFVGTDVGGFVGAPTAELYTRWLQSALFAPFLRTHTAFGTPDQEPWSYGTRHEAANRRAIELRYELLPQIYDVMEEASRTGLPALRPVFLEEPDDPRTWDLDSEAFLGHDLLFAPVLSPGAEKRWIYLPNGEWYDFFTGERRTGGDWTPVPVTLDSIPLFARAGAIVFRGPVIQHTGERAGKPLRVDVWPAATRSERSHYEDDGETLGYLKGRYSRRRFVVEPTSSGLAITVSGPEGTWRPEPRSLEFHVRFEGKPKGITVDGKALGRRADGAAGVERSWEATADGFVVVRLPDEARPLRVELAR